MITDNQHIMVYFDILKKNKGIIILFTFLTVFTVGIVSVLKPDIYQASSSILIDIESENILDMSDVVTLGSDYYAYTEYLNTQIEVLKSRSIAEEVFDQLSLKDRLKEPYVNNPDSFLVKMRQNYKNLKLSVKEKIKLIKNKKKGNSATGEVSHYKLLESLRKRIKVTHLRDTRMVMISFEHHNPELAAEVVNTLTKIYIDNNLKRKVQASGEALIWLKNEIKKIKDTLKYKENELQIFREQNNIISDNEKRVTLNQTISELEKEITEMETSYAMLLSKYTEKHPKVIQLLNLISNMTKNLEQKRDEAILCEKKFIVYNELSQDIEITKAMLEHIMHREKQTLISGSTYSNNISVIESAIVPFYPIKPKRKLNVLLALFLGFFGGVSISYMIELFKKHVHSSQDFLIHQIPFLDYVPVITKTFINDNTSKDSFLLFNHKGFISEIFNNLRTSVILNAQIAKDNKFGKSLLFTSFLPGEGKTFISCNLALAFSKYQFKVLLVEADLRKPRISKVFDLEKKTGLTDYLQNKAELKEVISKTTTLNFDVLPTGNIPDNPSELIGSPRFKEMVNMLESEYDVIIYDAPPAFSVTDPIILSSIIKNTVIVSKYNSTPKYMIPILKEKLETTNTNIVGAILNQVLNIDEISSYTSYYSVGYN